MCTKVLLKHIVVMVCVWAYAVLNGAGAGTWSQVESNAPGPVGTLLLLTDGTVLAANEPTIPNVFGSAWYRLTPDNHGSYVKGSWSVAASMNFSRLYYASVVLRDGRVFVAGAEYGTGWNKTEVYDPILDNWSVVPVSDGLVVQENTVNSKGQNSGGFLDAGCFLLPDGKVLVSPVSPATYGGTVIFDPVLNTNYAGPALTNSVNTDEETFVKLLDQSVLTFDSNQKSQRYIPALNRWIPDTNAPIQLFDAYGGELGAGFLLPNGNAFFLGANGNTLIYTPSGSVSPGTWTVGPVIPNGLGTPDAAAAMMFNGKILCALSPVPNSNTNKYPTPLSFWEYDYTQPPATAFVQVTNPPGISVSNSLPTYVTRMLALPNGDILLAYRNSQLYVYHPDGAPLSVAKPSIQSITPNGDTSYHLVGRGLNGISAGAAYGDDVQMDSNYPLVRITDALGNVFYARTYNWSSTGVATGNNPVSTEFSVALARGDYTLEVIANGLASDPVSLAGPFWVDFASTLPPDGSFERPYPTLASGVLAASLGGSLFIKPGSTPETMTLNKPLTLFARGGLVTIGR